MKNWDKDDLTINLDDVFDENSLGDIFNFEYLSWKADIAYYHMLDLNLIDIETDEGIDKFYAYLWQYIDDKFVNDYDPDIFFNKDSRLLNKHLERISNWTIEQYDKYEADIRLKYMDIEFDFEKIIRIKRENSIIDPYRLKINFNLNNIKRPSINYLGIYLECYKDSLVNNTFEIIKKEIDPTYHLKEEFKMFNSESNAYEETSIEFEYKQNIGLNIIQPDFLKKYYLSQYEKILTWLQLNSTYSSDLKLFSLSVLWSNCLLIEKKNIYISILTFEELNDLWWYDLILSLSYNKDNELNHILLLIFSSKFKYLDENLLNLSIK